MMCVPRCLSDRDAIGRRQRGRPRVYQSASRGDTLLAHVVQVISLLSWWRRITVTLVGRPSPQELFGGRIGHRREGHLVRRNGELLGGVTCCIAACFCFAIAGQEASGQPSFSVVGTLRQAPTSDGSPLYRVSLSVRSRFNARETAIESLVSPDGTLATALSSDLHVVSADDLSSEEARSLFSGTWTFTEVRGGQPLQYQFDLPEVSTSLFPAAPVIVSPAEGDTVRSGFLLDLEYPGGRVGGRLSYSYRTPGLGIRPSLPGYVDSPTPVPLTFSEGVTAAELTLRMGQTQLYFIDVMPVSPGADASFPLSAIVINSLSLPVTVTAVQVPEPTIAPLLTVLASLCIRRRS